MFDSGCHVRPLSSQSSIGLDGTRTAVRRYSGYWKHATRFRKLHPTLLAISRPFAPLPCPPVTIPCLMAVFQRGQFGEERYEKEEFQRTVRATFLALMEEDKVFLWEIIKGGYTPGF